MYLNAIDIKKALSGIPGGWLNFQRVNRVQRVHLNL